MHLHGYREARLRCPFREGLRSSCWSAVGRQPLAVRLLGSRELLAGSPSTEVGVESPRHFGLPCDSSNRASSSRAPHGIGWGCGGGPTSLLTFPLPSPVPPSPRLRGLSQGLSLRHTLNAKLCLTVRFLQLPNYSSSYWLNCYQNWRKLENPRRWKIIIKLYVNTLTRVFPYFSFRSACT